MNGLQLSIDLWQIPYNVSTRARIEQFHELFLVLVLVANTIV